MLNFMVLKSRARVPVHSRLFFIVRIPVFFCLMRLCNMLRDDTSPVKQEIRDLRKKGKRPTIHACHVVITDDKFAP
jgi:hypothetical protein